MKAVLCHKPTRHFHFARERRREPLSAKVCTRLVVAFLALFWGLVFVCLNGTTLAWLGW